MTGALLNRKNRHRTWTVFAVALCSLLLLMLAPAVTALRRSEELYSEVRRMQRDQERNRQLLEGMGRNLYTISIVIREFFLDSAPDTEREYLQQLLDRRHELEAELREMREVSTPQEEVALSKLRGVMDDYWQTILPVFEWTPEQRVQRATYFLREEQRPRRQSMLALTEEIRRLNNAFYQKQFERVNASEKKFRRDIERALMIAFLVGVGVSAASIVRIGWLERRFLEQHEQAQRTGEELRHLSTQLRHAQEDERKEISRELHDAVGQKLTALRMELGGMDRLRHGPESEFDERLAEIKQLAEQSLRLIRDLAAGLRPTMLDDLGLQPALQKQARQFSRHTNIPVSVEVEGDLDHLPERHKVYLYRIVQESLTNCARHARAKKISVTMKGGDDSVLVAVEDDGVGFDPAAAAGNGIGLVGIEERARELGGTMDLHSQPGMGTRLEVRIPVNGEST